MSPAGTSREGPIGRVILTGATGLVGPRLVPLLAERGIPVQAISRRAPPAASAHTGTPAWITLDLAAAPDAATAALGPADALVHAAPLWLLPPWLPAFATVGVRRVVAFSSTSRFTKQASSTPAERHVAQALAEAESGVEAVGRELGIRWTLLRPTLVYDGRRDRNVSEIARFVARWGFFPVAGPACGGRQPVHAADLAAAAVAVLDNPATFDRAYDLPGGETLTYAEMARRIALGMGRRPRLAHVPLPLLRAAAITARLLPRWRHVTPDMGDRMNEDLVFDAAPARHDFGYDPRPFVFPVD